MGDWGEAQVLMAGGTVTPAAREAFEAALASAGYAFELGLRLAIALQTVPEE